MDGNRLALFLLQTLIDTLKDYETKYSDRDPEATLSELKIEEELLFKGFRESIPTELLDKCWGPLTEDKVPHSWVDLEVFFRGKSICKTARTPAQTRYLGYLTDTDKVGGIALASEETFDVGLTKDEADKTDANGVMRLVQAEHYNTCKTAINMPDYKDFFYAHEKDGLVKLTIPNKAERVAYNYDSSKMKGVVVLYMGGCDWGRCAKGDLRWEDYDEGKVEIEVNGQAVTSVGLHHNNDYGRVCNHANGVFFKPNSDGVFEIGVKVKEPGSWFRLSTVVVF